MKELTEPKEPHRVKDTEKDRINPAYVNLTEKQEFIPQEDIVYLWAFNSNKELVVGIEHPWKHPECFNINTKNEYEMEIWSRISVQLQTLIEGIEKHYGFGHPTLAAGFDELGNVEIGLGHLGGELKCINGDWIIDNKSGRFGRYEETNPDIQKQVENTINEVTSVFNEAGIHVTPKLDFENPKIDSPLYTNETKQTFFIQSFGKNIENTALETRQMVEKKSTETKKSVEDIAEETFNKIMKK